LYFPITIIDDFYKNFNEIEKFAKNLEYFDKIKFSMPGKQSKSLNELNQSLFTLSTQKIMRNFFNRLDYNFKYECRTRFEKIIPYGKEYKKEGWVHSDADNKLSAIFYVDGDYDEGTSFFRKKTIGIPNETLMIFRDNLFKNQTPDPLQYNRALKHHSDQFEEILKVPLIKNRIVIFDSSIFHRSDGLGSLEKPRIIQTFFFGQIHADSFPIPEINRIQ
jgi:hypothetical protein